MVVFVEVSKFSTHLAREERHPSPPPRFPYQGPVLYPPITEPLLRTASSPHTSSSLHSRGCHRSPRHLSLRSFVLAKEKIFIRPFAQQPTPYREISVWRHAAEALSDLRCVAKESLLLPPDLLRPLSVAPPRRIELPAFCVQSRQPLYHSGNLVSWSLSPPPFLHFRACDPDLVESTVETGRSELSAIDNHGCVSLHQSCAPV